MLKQESTIESPIEALYRQFMPHYTSDSHNLSVAIELAKTGYPVFPCKEDGQKGTIKSPYTWNGFKDATTDPSEIRRMWRRHPDAVVGLPTGERSGLAVVDLDIRDDGRDGESALEAAGIDARSAVRVHTPSGGLHLYFRHADGIGSAGGILSGVDVRGEGGYVIAPGSRMADGTIYRYVGRDRLDDDALRLPRFPAAIRDMMSRPRNDGESDVEPIGLTLDQARSYLDELADNPAWRDRRDGWLKIGMGLHHEFEGGDEAFELWRRFSEESEFYNLRELRQQWRSFRDDRANPVTFGSIIDAARGEWAMTTAEARAAFEDDEDDIPDGDSSHLTFRRPSEIEETESRRQIVKGLVAAGDVGCVIGAPGVGKSLLAPCLGYAIAQGRDVFGLRVRQGLSFYVAAEDQFGMGQRVRALRRQNGEAEEFVLVGGVSDLLSKGSRDLRELRSAVKEQRPAVVFIDTLAMAFPGLEENSAEGMGRVVAVARSLTKWGAAVVLIHHDTKDGAQGLPRGHSLLNGALDFSLMLKRGDDDIVRGKLTKNRNGSCDLDIAFRIATETLGEDDDGDEITAARCEPLESTGERRPPLTDNEREVLDVLRDLCAGRAGHGVTEETWRRAYLRTCGDEKPDSVRKRFGRVRKSLLRGEWAFASSGFIFANRSDSETWNLFEEIEDDVV